MACQREQIIRGLKNVMLGDEFYARILENVNKPLFEVQGSNLVLDAVAPDV